MLTTWPHNIWLLCHPSMRGVANDITRCCKNLETMKPFRGIEFKNIINWQKFPDNWPNLFIENVKDMAGKDVIFLASFHSPEVIFEQLSVIYTLPKYMVRSFTLILPYFPTATMERVDTEGQIATAHTLACLVSNIPFSSRGPAKILIYDIHALQERFYFSDKVIPRLETAIPLLINILSHHTDEEKVIVFPDEGAYKRFHLSFGPPDYSEDKFITCTKIRVGPSARMVTIKEGDPKGKHCIIVDDLVMTGGTLLECAKVLYKSGASNVSAYVTHAVFPNESWKLFTKGNIKNNVSSNLNDSLPRGKELISADLPENTNESKVQFKKFWITDSIPHAHNIALHEPFELLLLAEVISESLLGYDLCIT